MARNSDLFDRHAYDLEESIREGAYNLRIKSVTLAHDNGNFFCALIDLENRRRQFHSKPARIVVVGWFFCCRFNLPKYVCRILKTEFLSSLHFPEKYARLRFRKLIFFPHHTTHLFSFRLIRILCSEKRHIVKDT